MMKAVSIGVGTGLVCSGLVHLGIRRHLRNHDAAFNQMMWEIWENPNRTAPADEDPRIKELDDYLDGGFFHVLLNDPPLNALEKFKEVSVEEYNDHCLGIAKSKVAEAIKTLESSQ